MENLFQSNFPVWLLIQRVKGFSVVKEADVDVLLQFSYSLHDPVNVDNLISGSSAFSKSRLYIWKFSVHILLKPSLKDFEHYIASMWNEHNCTMIWTFFGIAFFQDWNENWPFSSPVDTTAKFSKFAAVLSEALSQQYLLRTWNSSAGIPSPPLALFVAMLVKAHLTSHSMTSGSRGVTAPSWLSGSLRLFFCIVHLCVLVISSLLLLLGHCHSVLYLLIFAWYIPFVFPVLLRRSLVFPNIFSPLFSALFT